VNLLLSYKLNLKHQEVRTVYRDSLFVFVYVIFRVPEANSKRIIYMTLEAVSFCHSHNVSHFAICTVWFELIFKYWL